MNQEKETDPWSNLIDATENFLDAFVAWELETHLDFGGGDERTVGPGESIGDALTKLMPTEEQWRQQDELRKLLRQAAHRLATRGFTGEDADIG